MDIRFRLPDAPDDSELQQLHDWLRGDRDVRTNCETSLLPSAPRPDGMGVALDAVQLILDSGFQLASLAVAIASWRKAHEPRSAMTVTRGDVEIRLGRADLDDVRTVLDALERLREAEEEPDAPGDDDASRGGAR